MGEIRTFTVDIPLDEDGFILLKCPLCGELFKLKATDYKADDALQIYCPSCGLLSDSYITDDVKELGLKQAENYANELIFKELKKLEKQSKGLFKVTSKLTKLPEEQISLKPDTLEIETYKCCNKEAKISSTLKISGGYCPYCGGMNDGIE